MTALLLLLEPVCLCLPAGRSVSLLLLLDWDENEFLLSGDNAVLLSVCLSRVFCLVVCVCLAGWLSVSVLLSVCVCLSVLMSVCLSFYLSV